MNIHINLFTRWQDKKLVGHKELKLAIAQLALKYENNISLFNNTYCIFWNIDSIMSICNISSL